MTDTRRALVRARVAAGWSQERLAAHLGVDRSTVQRWEAGTTSPQPHARACLAAAFGLGSVELTAMLDNVPLPVSTDVDDIGDLDLSDRSLPHGGSTPWSGDPESASRELLRLQRIDQDAGAERVLPTLERLLREIRAGLTETRGVDRQILLVAAARAAEFAGFCHRDLGAEQRCLYWHDRAVEYAQQAGDGPMLAYVLLRKAQAAYDRRDATRMLDLVLAATRLGAVLGPGLNAEILQQQARGEAMLGAGGDDVRRRLDEAATTLAAGAGQRADGEPGCFYSEGLLGLQSALCLSEAGRPREAVVLYRQVIGPELAPRDHAYFSLLMATSLGLSGEPDEAARVACSVLPVVIDTRSRRSLGEARNLATVLNPWRERDRVRRFHHALRAASESSAG